MLSFATQTLTRRRAPVTDDGHGNQKPNWGAATDTPLHGWSIQPGTVAADRVNRDGARIDYTVFGPPDADVEATDRFLIDGAVYVTDGPPQRWATGILDHTVLYLTRWEG